MQRGPRGREGETSHLLVRDLFHAAMPLMVAEAAQAKGKLGEVGSMDEEGKGQWKGNLVVCSLKLSPEQYLLQKAGRGHSLHAHICTHFPAFSFPICFCLLCLVLRALVHGWDRQPANTCPKMQVSALPSCSSPSPRGSHCSGCPEPSEEALQH